MIYLKKNEETQIVNIPKNGDYKGKLTYEEGYEVGKAEGIEEGKNNPYSTKGVFVENGLQKHIAWGFNVERNYPVSWMDDDNILEISFYPLREGGLITSDRAYFDFVLEGGKLIARVDDFEVSVVCELFKWHTLKMQGNGFWLDKKYYEYPKSTSYQGTMHIGRSWRDGRYYGGYISYIYATEDDGVEMYYYYDKNDGQIKRLNKRNGIWKHENQMWGTFPPIEETPPMESVMISVPQEGGNCPELTELNVSENGRYEGAYNIVNVDVPDVNGSYDEGYNNGYNDGLNAGGGSCNLGQLDVNWVSGWDENRFYAFDDGYDGYSAVSIYVGNAYREIKEETKNKIESELQTLTITENGHYEPTKVKYMEIDSDDVFQLGEFNSRNIYDITFTPKASNYDSKIFGGWVDGKYMGLTIEGGDIIARWGTCKAQAPYTEGEITHIVIKPFSDDSAFIINDNLHGWWVDDESATDDFSTDMYLGETDGRTANFDFYKMTIYEDYEGWVNDYNKIAVILPYADNQIDVQGVLKENIGDGAYCAMKEEKLSLGFKEVNVNVPTEGGNCNLQDKWVEYNSPDELTDSAYVDVFPDEGYDGMGRVVADVRGLMQYKYDEGYNNAIANGANLIPARIEKEYNTIALRTENIFDSDIIRDRTQLVGSGDEYTENGFISYTQNKNGIVISGSDEVGAKYVTKIRKDALNWNTIEYFYSYTIVNFGVDMTRDAFSNVREIHIKYNGGVGTGVDSDIYFRAGCFATSNLLNKIVFYEPYYINVEDKAFEGVSSRGKVIVIGEDNAENRAKYDTLMSQLGSKWTLTFVDEYYE